MAYETRDNSGRLFKNEDKKSDKHPDYSGDALIDGQAYFMDAWLKTAESGRRWMSCSFKPKQQKQQSAPQKQQRRSRDEDDSIPL